MLQETFLRNACHDLVISGHSVNNFWVIFQSAWLTPQSSQTDQISILQPPFSSSANPTNNFANDW